MNKKEWKKQHGYDIMIARCNVCRYFKVNKFLANNYGNCRLMEKETAQDKHNPSYVAHTACCDRFMDRYGVGFLGEEQKWAVSAQAV